MGPREERFVALRGRVAGTVGGSILAVLVLVVVSAQVGAVAADGRSGSRLAGNDRYATSAAIARHAWPDGAATAYLTRSDVGADALSASTLRDGPVLLVPPCGPVPTTILAVLDDLGTEQVVALGGSMAVAPQVLEQAVAGEQDTDLACPGDLTDEHDGVQLSANHVGDTVEFVLFNGSSDAVETGRRYVLEVRNGAGFDPLDPPVGPVFSDELLRVEPSSSVVLGRVGPTVTRDNQSVPLESGTYRVRWLVEDVELAAVFTYTRPES